MMNLIRIKDFQKGWIRLNLFLGGQLFFIIFGLLFCLMFCFTFFMIIKQMSIWNKNNHSPVLTVKAKIVGKREHVRFSSSSDGAGSSHTTYFVCFQVESGDRMELMVSGYEYGLLLEGDEGQLTFQGTRYKSFERSFDQNFSY